MNLAWFMAWCMAEGGVKNQNSIFTTEPQRPQRKNYPAFCVLCVSSEFSLEDERAVKGNKRLMD